MPDASSIGSFDSFDLASLLLDPGGGAAVEEAATGLSAVGHRQKTSEIETGAECAPLSGQNDGTRAAARCVVTGTLQGTYGGFSADGRVFSSGRSPSVRPR